MMLQALQFLLYLEGYGLDVPLVRLFCDDMEQLVLLRFYVYDTTLLDCYYSCNPPSPSPPPVCQYASCDLLVCSYFESFLSSLLALLLERIGIARQYREKSYIMVRVFPTQPSKYDVLIPGYIYSSLSTPSNEDYLHLGIFFSFK